MSGPSGMTRATAPVARSIRTSLAPPGSGVAAEIGRPGIDHPEAALAVEMDGVDVDESRSRGVARRPAIPGGVGIGADGGPVDHANRGAGGAGPAGAGDEDPAAVDGDGVPDHPVALRGDGELRPDLRRRSARHGEG